MSDPCDRRVLSCWVLLFSIALPAVVVSGVNNPPVLFNLDGDSVIYEIGAGFLMLDVNADVLVSDPDSPDFLTGGVVVTVTENYLSDQDSLRMVSYGGMTIVGFNIKIGPTTVGQWDWDELSGALTAVFSSTLVTPQITQDVIKGLQYGNSSTMPEPLTRTITLTVEDGDGGTSLPQIITIVFPTPIMESGFE